MHFLYSQHRLGTSVLMLIILPLAFSCESGYNKNQITGDYRNIIRIQLKNVVSINITCMPPGEGIQTVLCYVGLFSLVCVYIYTLQKRLFNLH